MKNISPPGLIFGILRYLSGPTSHKQRPNSPKGRKHSCRSILSLKSVNFVQNKIATARMRSEKFLNEKNNPPRLKDQIVRGTQREYSSKPRHAQCYNIVNSCRLCYLYLVCNIPFTNSTVYFIKKKLKKIDYKGIVTFISPR